MNRQLVVAALILAVAACAAPEPKSPAPAETDDHPAADTVAPNDEGDLEVADIPEVPRMPSSGDQAVVADQREIICRSERRTGSHRITRICRTRQEMEEIELEAKKSFKEMLEIQRTQGEY